MNKIVITKPGYDALDQSTNISQVTDSNNVNSIYGGTGSSGESGQAFSQSFISTMKKIVSVDLKFWTYGTPTDNIQLDIVSTPGGTPLASVVLASANVNWITNFKFSSVVSTVVGQTYYLQVSRSGARDTTNRFAWYQAYNINPYTKGNVFERANSVWGANNQEIASDSYFKIYADYTDSAANPDNLIFSSDYDTLKYYLVDSVTLNHNYAGFYDYDDSGFFDIIYYHREVIEVTHNLGYVPFFIGYLMDYPSAGYDVQLPITAADGTSFAILDCYADSTKLYFLLYAGLANTNSGSVTYNLKYRIFKNDLGF